MSEKEKNDGRSTYNVRSAVFFSRSILVVRASLVRAHHIRSSHLVKILHERHATAIEPHTV